MRDLKVGFGNLLDLLGPPRTLEGLSIAAANVELGGDSFQLTGRLGEWAEGREVPSDLRELLEYKLDAIWVRGRMQALFQSPSNTEETRIEKSGIFCGFIAVYPSGEGETMLAVPFQCSDYYLTSHLFFSSGDVEPPLDLRERIASAFWGLLLSEPLDVMDYRDVMYHSGAGVWIRFGIENGEPFYEESDERPA